MGKGQTGDFARNLFANFARMRTKRHTPAAPYGRLTIAGAGTTEALLFPGLLAGTGHFTLALRISRTLVLMGLERGDSLMNSLRTLIRNSELVAEGHFAQLLPIAIFKQ
jgi:hypothetical protein